ncbi:BBT_HP_G0156120.mRNA.1.CDS.1 [Saccharomyces cerevisiae]|nr:BBT_HP_G0070220.mRNA.1.CDS.1 [Saccharomyces cerevisiae]CAI5084105.1 BBT_HP_G0124770.mRNA.1.CDS.1 [Saccharomyces cerevisiae]CAI5177224.1 BBT_HP_G0156120.mRNA.1.CDS.1 [Saccharomyces cerevisiae]CAI6848821.1 BBT_HP_G0070220.mRNA.1.CDS.1 [Saccharomyces cerevisiae]CAI6968498.1 BBT_HP_G0124770.mRNA.1.CDS.1 [Saccharomyces cerevisiae]
MSEKSASNNKAEFKRQSSPFREIISADHPIYKPAKGRYWLYVALPCPWAQRTLITRALKGLAPIIGCSVAHWHLDDKGWRFLEEGDGKTNERHWFDIAGGISSVNLNTSTPVANIPNNAHRLLVDGTDEPHYGYKRLSDFYFKTKPDYKGRFTVPVLCDLETCTIVNNESSDIIRIMNSAAFDEFVGEEYRQVRLVPRSLEAQITEFNSWVYDKINNGVYKAGFAECAEVYEREVTSLFQYLDKLENLLDKKYTDLEAEYGKNNKDKILDRYFAIGDTLTEADVRLYPTIVRFDVVYHQHFKCNLATIRDDYSRIHTWLKNIYWRHEAFQRTTDFTHIKLGYTRSQPRVNPIGITPLGPKPDIRPL